MTVVQNDVLEVSARSEFGGVEDVVNVFQFRYESLLPLPNPDAIDDILEIMEILYTIINVSLTILQLFRDIRIANRTQNTLLGTFSWPTLTVGGNPLSPTAPGVAFLTSFNTDVPRVGMRKYWGVMTEGDFDNDGTYAATLVATGVVLIATMLPPIIATNGTWQYGNDSGKTLQFEVPTGGLATDIPAYQRRRKQGRGS